MNKLKQLWGLVMAYPFRSLAILTLIVFGGLWLSDCASSFKEKYDKQIYDRMREGILQRLEVSEKQATESKTIADERAKEAEMLHNEIESAKDKLEAARRSYEQARHRTNSAGKAVPPASVVRDDTGAISSTLDHELCARAASLGITCSVAEASQH